MTMPPDDKGPTPDDATPDETEVTPTPAAQEPWPTPTPGSGPILDATPSMSTPPPPGPTSGWVSAPTRAEVVPGLEYASTASRIVAFIVDGFLIGILASVVAAVVPGAQTTSVAGGVVNSPVFNLVSALVGAAYFIGFWSGGRRATLGQMLFKLQVGNASDGRSLTTEQAVKRWLGLGLFLPIVGVVPGFAALAGLAEFVWVIVLWITTVSSPTKQGLHDRYAETAVVRPVGASNVIVWTCLVLVILIPIVIVFGVLSLVIVGSQVSTVLSEVGTSV